MDVLRVRNAAALDLPEVQALVRAAFARSRLSAQPDDVLRDLREYVHLDTVGLLIVRDGAEFVALALCENLSNAISPGCNVAHFYSKGAAPAAREALVGACVRFAHLGGQKRILGVDMNAAPRAFARLFRGAGPATPVGVLFSFDLSGDDLV